MRNICSLTMLMILTKIKLQGINDTTERNLTIDLSNILREYMRMEVKNIH